MALLACSTPPPSSITADGASPPLSSRVEAVAAYDTIYADVCGRNTDMMSSYLPTACYIRCLKVDSNGKLAGSHRKLHAFISPHVSSGSNFTVFELFGVR